jgi:hypothetical protein
MAYALDVITVDDPDEILELVVGDEERGLPGAAFVELTVGRDAEETPAPAVEPRPERHPRAHGKSVSETARGERDFWKRVEGWQRGQARPVLVIGLDIALAESADFCQQRVQRCDRVPFGQHQRVLFVHPSELQENEDLGARK